MSGIQNKNLLFYSTHPNDALSKQCLDYLDKNATMNKQFIRICIHDPRDFTRPPPNIRLPQIVEQCKQRGLIPLLAIAGLKEPVFANAAISWMKESSLNKDDLLSSNIHGSGIADNCCTLEQASQTGNSLFDTDYNIGFSNGRGEFNKGYASIDESLDSKIVTYDDSGDRKSTSNDVSSRMEQLKYARDQDTRGQSSGPAIPPPPRTMSSMPSMSAPQMSMPSMPSMPRGRNNNW
jgi:hypothetical protein